MTTTPVPGAGHAVEFDVPESYVPPGAERPGEYPFTRGPFARMYRERLWVMGMYSGYASPSETNARFRRLLEAGQTGLSIALDLPTQLGMDSDAALAAGEVGKVGVPLNSVDDLKLLLDGLPLHEVRQMRTSANSIGPIFTAFLLVALEELGGDPAAFRVMVQNDPLKEYIARGTYIFPPAAAVKLAVDNIEYYAEHHPHWEPIEFCGYHIRDAGATAVQELGIATAHGLTYLDAAAARDVPIATVAPQLFLFLGAGPDIFEEAAKFRAARRLWAKLLHERYGVPKERAAIKIFAYTSGSALWAQEPLNNTVRVTCETLGAVLGGMQTLATSSYDEALGLPTQTAAHLALRTQQIVAHESGATKVVDPLAGSYYVEDLTDRIEVAARDYAAWIEETGGVIEGIASGLLATEIADSAYDLQQEIESGAKPIVGVNIHRADAADMTSVFRVPEDATADVLERLDRTRRERDAAAAQRGIDKVVAAARDGDNTIPALIDAARARATLGEICDALKAVYGTQSAMRLHL